MRRAALEEAERLAEQDVADNRALGRHGAALVPDGAQVLTHCNAGGAGLRRVRHGPRGDPGRRRDGRRLRGSGSTRPGPSSRAPGSPPGSSTGSGIPATLVADVMAGSLMAVERRRPGGGRRRPGGGQRRRGQQDRDLLAGRAGRPPRRALLRGRAHVDHRPGHPDRGRRSPSRSARPRRSARSGGRRLAPGGHGRASTGPSTSPRPPWSPPSSPSSASPTRPTTRASAASWRPPPTACRSRGSDAARPCCPTGWGWRPPGRPAAGRGRRRGRPAPSSVGFPSGRDPPDAVVAGDDPVGAELLEAVEVAERRHAGRAGGPPWWPGRRPGAARAAGRPGRRRPGPARSWPPSAVPPSRNRPLGFSSASDSSQTSAVAPPAGRR